MVFYVGVLTQVRFRIFWKVVIQILVEDTLLVKPLLEKLFWLVIGGHLYLKMPMSLQENVILASG